MHLLVPPTLHLHVCTIPQSPVRATASNQLFCKKKEFAACWLLVVVVFGMYGNSGARQGPKAAISVMSTWNKFSEFSASQMTQQQQHKNSPVEDLSFSSNTITTTTTTVSSQPSPQSHPTPQPQLTTTSTSHSNNSTSTSQNSPYQVYQELKQNPLQSHLHSLNTVQKQHLLSLYSAAIKSLPIPQHANDPSLLLIWLDYLNIQVLFSTADDDEQDGQQPQQQQQQQHQQIGQGMVRKFYETMYGLGVGRKLARFYLSWADYVLGGAGGGTPTGGPGHQEGPTEEDVSYARSILQLGHKEHAQPEHALLDKLDQLNKLGSQSRTTATTSTTTTTTTTMSNKTCNTPTPPLNGAALDTTNKENRGATRIHELKPFLRSTTTSSATAQKTSVSASATAHSAGTTRRGLALGPPRRVNMDGREVIADIPHSIQSASSSHPIPQPSRSPPQPTPSRPSVGSRRDQQTPKSTATTAAKQVKVMESVSEQPSDEQLSSRSPSGDIEVEVPRSLPDGMEPTPLPSSVQLQKHRGQQAQIVGLGPEETDNKQLDDNKPPMMSQNTPAPNTTSARPSSTTQQPQQPRQLPSSSSTTATAARKTALLVNGRIYAKLELIGRGGSSKVFKVLAPDGKLYALKRVHLKGVDPAALSGYLNEIELLRKLAESDRIIKLIEAEVNEREGYLHVVMECGEIDLAGVLNQKKKEHAERLHQQQQQAQGYRDGVYGSGISMNFIRVYWEQMLQAVHAIHEHRVVHSDLKPANFLFVRGALKLIDFGIAKAIQNDTTNIHREHQVGTVNYMSPEAIVDTNSYSSSGSSTDRNRPQCMKLGRPSDVWSLGCILYQMVYGKTPFHDLPMIPKLQRIIDPRAEIPVPPIPNPYLMEVMKSCLRRDPTQRMTIPELLRHEFLRPDDVMEGWVTRPPRELVEGIVRRVLEEVDIENRSGGGGSMVSVEKIVERIVNTKNCQ